ncbi:iron ABC transporter permease [Phaeovibrio sulfidiphilus]|uniref:Iron ABC transporter permease n=1 Tax=Phaeovibrio sulfidiphilus TaxID=1220600 RepID=A0A8J6YZH6_9PROT|nr:iron ABC transporter permease [Phaeovibrio sulfidiphilus]MBE1237373.1 iron ABC transporter permease [Phaeovibrio sulfidiphilus]
MSNRSRILLLLGLLILASLVSLLVGQHDISPATIVRSMGRSLADLGVDMSSGDDVVLWKIRLPRILAAVVVGAALSVAGTAYQGMFRNPLVSPDILGVSAGAGLGAVLAIYLDFSVRVTQLFAFSGGLLAVTLVCAVAWCARTRSLILALVLSGVAVGSLFASGISLIKILSDPHSQLSSITFWLLGGLNTIGADDVLGALPWITLALAPLVLLRWRMNLLSFEDDEARAMGVDVTRTRIAFIVAATLMTSAVVAISGVIGWVGLVVPHMARFLTGPDFRILLPVSMLSGALFLVVTDTAARTVAPVEIPLGILTAFIGVPFFLVLLVRGGDRR